MSKQVTINLESYINVDSSEYINSSEYIEVIIEDGYKAFFNQLRDAITRTDLSSNRIHLRLTVMVDENLAKKLTGEVAA